MEGIRRRKRQRNADIRQKRRQSKRRESGRDGRLVETGMLEEKDKD